MSKEGKTPMNTNMRPLWIASSGCIIVGTAGMLCSRFVTNPILLCCLFACGIAVALFQLRILVTWFRHHEQDH